MSTSTCDSGSNRTTCYQILQRNSSVLAKAITDPKALAFDLFSENVIARQTVDEMDLSATTYDKSMKLVLSVLNQVYVTPEKFSSFVRILHTRDYLACVCSVLDPTYQSSHTFDQPSSHPNPSSSYSTPFSTDVTAQIESFEKRFETLVFDTFNYLQEKQTSVSKFRSSLTLLPLRIKRDHLQFLKDNLSDIAKAGDLEEIFMYLNLYWNFFDYSLLEHIIGKFGDSDSKKDMLCYVRDMENFRKTTVITQLPKSWPEHLEPPPHFVKVTSKLNRKASEYTLEELEKFRQEFCREFSLWKFLLMFQTFIEGSLIISWIVPLDISRYLANMARFQASSPGGCGFFMDHGVVELVVDGQCVYESSLTMSLEASPPMSSPTPFDYSKEFSSEEDQILMGDSVSQLQEQIERQLEEPIEAEGQSFTKHLSFTEGYEWVLFIRTLTGKTINIKCNKTDTIANIKETIKRKEGIPISNQQLVKLDTSSEHKERGKATEGGDNEGWAKTVSVVLENELTLINYGIRNGQELVLNQVAGVVPSVSESVTEFVTVTVKTSTGEKLLVPVNLNHTIISLKTYLQDKTGIPSETQKIIFSGRELKDHEILKSCNVKNTSTLHLVSIEFRDRVVYIQTIHGKKFHLECDVSIDTIGDLKAKIHNQESIAPDQQYLVFAGSRLKDDDKTLSQCNIKHGDTIHLAFKLGPALPLSKVGNGKIFIKVQNHVPMRVDVKASDTIAIVKAKVRQLLLGQEEGSNVSQELLFSGTKLENDQVLGDFDIHDGDTLHLLFGRVALQQVTVSGDDFNATVDVSSSNTIADLKLKIHEQGGISTERQKLMYAGNELDHQKTLGELNIPNGSTIYLETLQSTLPTITVKTLTGKEFSIELIPDATVLSVKAQIHSSEGIPSNQQNLFFEGRILDDDLTLKACGIQNESTVYVYGGEVMEPIIKIKVPSLQKTITLEYDPEQTIRSLKSKLHEKEQIQIKNQSLFFEGVLLEDNATIGFYAIPKEGAIDLVVTDQKTQNTRLYPLSEEADGIEEEYDSLQESGGYNILY